MTSIHDNGEVEFAFFRPQASRVLLCGDFNDWQPLAMQPAGDGWWKATAQLAGGEYRFRYRVDSADCPDGQWYTDYAAYGVEMTSAGTNSVLLVPAHRNQGTTLAA